MLVVVFEDDKEILDNICLALNMCLPGCHIVAHNSSKKCLGIIKDKRPDLVILDMDITGDDVFNLLEKIKHYFDIPVIGLSSTRDENEDIKALEMGVNEYINKPFRQLEFMARTRALLRRKGKSISS